MHRTSEVWLYVTGLPACFALVGVVSFVVPIGRGLLLYLKKRKIRKTQREIAQFFPDGLEEIVSGVVGLGMCLVYLALFFQVYDEANTSLPSITLHLKGIACVVFLAIAYAVSKGLDAWVERRRKRSGWS